MENQIIEQLKKLKLKLDNQKVSVLVGAGFSKNISSIFPTWSELLKDLVLFLYEKEIIDLYEIKSINNNSLNKKKFINEQVEYYINKIGYLNIVSEYIKRKGYRESITTYIEEKTPKIVYDKDEVFLINKLSGKENKVKINDENFSLHKKLLNINWNNIYTTNYDEMLEHANTLTVIESINNEIENIKREIESLKNEVEEINKDLNEIKSNYKIVPKIINDSFFNSVNSVFTTEDNDTEEIKDIKANGNKLQQEKANINRKVKIKEEKLLQLEQALNNSYSLVIKSEDLSIKRNKNIIKLHGTIRKDKLSFGFDGDIKKQYIIAKEDYETYPTKHEAFTQLMRISLLQESYCLIGFSGTDPNFLEWVKWVRDILDSQTQSNKYKIYLIEVNDKEVTSDKLLFYENHHIFRIPLLKNEIVVFLEEKTKIKLIDKKDKKKILELLFIYLSNNSIFDFSKTKYELLQKTKYQELWNNLNIENIDLNLAKEIEKLKKHIQFPSLNFAYSSNKLKFLFYSVNTLQKQKKLKDKDIFLSIVYIAIKDTFLLPYFIWDKQYINIFNKIIKNSKLYYKFELINLRQSVFLLDKRSFNRINKTLISNNQFKDEIEYNSILFSAFSLNFEELLKKINKWKPSNFDINKKVGLLALFDKDKATKLVTTEFYKLDKNTSQEQLFTLHLIRYLKKNLFIFDKDINEKINTYKNAGIQDINENIDLLIRQIKNDKDNIQPYGKNRFSISNIITLSNDFTKQQNALQFIQILIETGFPISLQSVHLIENSKWYPIFKMIYEFFPYPALFYSLQYSNNDFLKRIGQDYAYSIHLNKHLSKILETLLKAYFCKVTPNHIKQNILVISTELLIAVPYSNWNKYLNLLLKSDKFINSAFADRAFIEYEFLVEAIKYTNSTILIRKIIKLSLQRQNKDSAITILYNLNSNNFIKKNKSIIQNNLLSKEINKVINNISNDEKSIFIIGNINDILTNAQINEFKTELSKLNFKQIKNNRLWNVILYFLSDNKNSINKIKKAIINNKGLWNAGFTSKGLSIGNYFIEINRLRKSNNTPKGLIWSKSEAKEIFIKLKSELNKIEEWLKKSPETSFLSILLEMKLFLELEEAKLINNSEYKKIYNKVVILYNQQKGYGLIQEGLLSKDKTKVVWALNELAIQLYDFNQIKSLKSDIDILINKVLMKSEPALEASIKYLSFFIADKRNKSFFIKHKKQISTILREYYNKEFEEIDKPYLAAQLIKIAKTLQKWKYKNEYVDKWLVVYNNSSFNNIENELYE